MNDPIINTALNQDVRPAAEVLEALIAYTASLKAELAALQAYAVSQAYSLSEPIEDGRSQLPVKLSDVVLVRDLVDGLDVYVNGGAPSVLADAAATKTALALIGIQTRKLGR